MRFTVRCIYLYCSIKCSVGVFHSASFLLDKSIYTSSSGKQTLPIMAVILLWRHSRHPLILFLTFFFNCPITSNGTKIYTYVPGTQNYSAYKHLCFVDSFLQKVLITFHDWVGRKSNMLILYLSCFLWLKSSLFVSDLEEIKRYFRGPWKYHRPF